MYLCSTKMNVETIVLKDLGIGYPSKHGVRVVAEHINGAVRSGELTCLLGANGVGKSTLLRTLSALGIWRNSVCRRRRAKQRNLRDV